MEASSKWEAYGDLELCRKHSRIRGSVFSVSVECRAFLGNICVGLQPHVSNTSCNLVPPISCSTWSTTGPYTPEANLKPPDPDLDFLAMVT